jgi:hypothetical protein
MLLSVAFCFQSQRSGMHGNGNNDPRQYQAQEGNEDCDNF